jgi:hypothetical protein
MARPPVDLARKIKDILKHVQPLPEEVKAPGPWEPIVPDTGRAYIVGQMAQAWTSLRREITEDDVPLSVDPDDYPLF